MARKRDDTVKLVLRLPPALHRQLTRIATRKNQSLNSEMVQRLEKSLASDAEELERLRLLKDSHRRLEEELPSGRLSAAIEKLDRLIAGLAKAEELERLRGSGILGTDKDDGEKK